MPLDPGVYASVVVIGRCGMTLHIRLLQVTSNIQLLVCNDTTKSSLAILPSNIRYCSFSFRERIHENESEKFLSFPKLSFMFMPLYKAGGNPV